MSKSPFGTLFTSGVKPSFSKNRKRDALLSSTPAPGSPVQPADGLNSRKEAKRPRLHLPNDTQQPGTSSTGKPSAPETNIEVPSNSSANRESGPSAAVVSNGKTVSNHSEFVEAVNRIIDGWSQSQLEQSKHIVTQHDHFFEKLFTSQDKTKVMVDDYVAKLAENQRSVCNMSIHNLNNVVEKLATKQQEHSMLLVKTMAQSMETFMDKMERIIRLTAWTTCSEGVRELMKLSAENFDLGKKEGFEVLNKVLDESKTKLTGPLTDFPPGTDFTKKVPEAAEANAVDDNAEFVDEH